MSDVMISAKELTKRYGGFTAIDRVTFEVRKGEVLGFVGPNGAGKTTTMKILTCFIAPSEGTATVNGADVFDDSMKVRASIGYLPESTPLYPEMLVLEYLEWVADMRGIPGEERRKRLRKAAEQTSLGEVASKPIGQLSKGFRQRVGLAQALIHEPPILILDEPMSGLDPNQAAEIRDLIKSIGRERTVILSTHNLALVEAACDRVMIISRGKIVANDTPDGLSRNAGPARVVATFSGDTDQAKARESLAGVDGAAAATVLRADGELVLEVQPKADTDLRHAVREAATAAGLDLLELRRERPTLEAVFRTLTTDGSDANRSS